MESVLKINAKDIRYEGNEKSKNYLQALGTVSNELKNITAES